MNSMNKYKKYMPAFVLLIIAVLVFFTDIISNDNIKQKYNKTGGFWMDISYIFNKHATKTPIYCNSIHPFHAFRLCLFQYILQC